MRQHLSPHTCETGSVKKRIGVVALSVTLVTAVAATSIGSSRSTAPVVPDRILRSVDTVAVVEAINVDTDWSQQGDVTIGAARLTLDDLRTITIHPGTLVDDYRKVPACTTLDQPRTCVFLADMLGEAVVWFALIPADTARGGERLTLPGLVDMQSNGDEGILSNGWVLPLANGVKRECGDTDTAHLRDFITRFPDEAARTIVDTITDTVVRVECVK